MVITIVKEPLQQADVAVHGTEKKGYFYDQVHPSEFDRIPAYEPSEYGLVAIYGTSHV